MNNSIISSWELPENARELVLILNAQMRAMKDKDWTPVAWQCLKDNIDGHYTVNITSHDIGFSFDEKGNFLGIYNYKD